MVFYTGEIFHLTWLAILTQRYTLGLILVQGANSPKSREQGDTKIDLGSMKNYFGEHQEKNSGSREKRVKFQREPGAGDPLPYGVSVIPPHAYLDFAGLTTCRK